MSGLPVTDVLRRLDGAARARDLVALCGRRSLRRAYEAGDVVRVSYGRYALPACPDPWVSALRLSAVVSHTSAAQLWGMDLLVTPTAPHVIVGRHRHRVDGRGAIVHWADLQRDEVDDRGRVTTPLRTVLDCARLLPFAEALAIADSALRQGLVTRGDLIGAAQALVGGGRRRVGHVVECANARAASVLESALRALLIEGAIVGFQPQLEIRDERSYFRVDLGNELLRIVLEADSFEHHGSRADLVRDCWRYDELVIRGWLVLRVSWEHVMFEPDWVVATIRAAVRQRAGRQLGGQKRPH